MRAFLVSEPRTASLRALNYGSELEKIRRTGSNSAAPLGSMVSSIGDAFGTVFVRRDCAPEFGVPLLSQTDTFAAEPLGRIIRRDSMPFPDDHVVRPWQILVSGAGQMAEGNLFGRSIIADARLAGGYLGPDTVALNFEEPGNELNLWTYAYLNTSVGLAAIRTAAFGTSIPRIRLDLLREVPVPKGSKGEVKRVAALVRNCVKDRERFLISLREARSLVESLPAMTEAHAMCADRARRAVVWDGPLPTLSAWNVASTGGALGHLKGNWNSELGDVVEDNGIYNGPRFARIECSAPFGVEFMSQRDAMLIRPAPRRIVHPGFSDRLLFAPAGTILVGSHGTLGEGEIFGRAFVVHGRYARAAFTQDLLRVLPKKGLGSALFAYLTTMVGFRLLRSTAVGTKILSMREDMLRALPVPEWPGDLHEKVSSLVDEAFAAREAADEAEAEAIRIVEEEVLPQWLG